MKRILNCIVLFSCITTFTTCVKESVTQDDTKEKCIDCMTNDLVRRTIKLGSGDSTITIYPVMTPNNHDICDSMVYSPIMGTYVPPYYIYKFQKLCTTQEALDSIKVGNDTACPCIKNPDTLFNDYQNSFFYIEGISKFQYNCLTIYWYEQNSIYGGFDNFPNNLIKKNLTKKKRVYYNYENTNDVFIGEVDYDAYFDYSAIKPKTLPSGIYDYSLALYKDEKHTIQIGETIEGKFAIIRSNRVLTKGCKNQAHDKDDPLLN